MVQVGGNPVPAVLADDQQRLLPVFTSQEALQLWRQPHQIALVEGATIIDVAEAQQVNGIYLDPAGPEPFIVALDSVRDLLDAISRTEAGAVLAEDPDFTEAPADERTLATRSALAELIDLTTRTFLVDRVVGSRRLRTVAVEASNDVAAELAHGLQERGDVGSLDVVVLDRIGADRLERHIPQSRVNPVR